MFIVSPASAQQNHGSHRLEARNRADDWPWRAHGYPVYPNCGARVDRPGVSGKLLFVGGILARAPYELKRQDMGTRWRTSVTSNKPDEPLDPEVRKTKPGIIHNYLLSNPRLRPPSCPANCNPRSSAASARDRRSLSSNRSSTYERRIPRSPEIFLCFRRNCCAAPSRWWRPCEREGC